MSRTRINRGFFNFQQYLNAPNLSGKALLRDAMQRTLQAADIAGIRALAVHAKDEEARRFYEHFDFAPSPTGPMHLFVLLKEVRRIISQ
jgi:hypothetical protein